MRALAIFAVAVSFSAAAAGPTKTVDLDRPGALTAIEQHDKPLFERISGILKAAEMEPCDTLPKLVETQFRGSLETCNGHVILTSYPAKIRVAFRLDEILYTSNVIQPRIKGRLLPATAK